MIHPVSVVIKQIDTSSQCRNFGMLNWNKSHKKGIKYIKKLVTYLTCSVSIFIQINLYNVVRVCNGPSLWSPSLSWSEMSWSPFSLYENPSFIIVSAETEYISTRSWYRNINFLRDQIRRIFLYPWFSSLFFR